MTSQCALKNVFHDVRFSRSGAGSMPCLFNIFFTVFGEPKPLSFELILEYTVLLYKIVDHCLLLAVKPAGQAGYQGMERLYGVSGELLIIA